MIFNADKIGVDSTANNDYRITKIGRLIRKFKFDELLQFINIIIGDMSLVGPRPNVKTETDLYSSQERLLLSIKPGITDISSIIFYDLGEILDGHSDANIAYNQLVRPWKSKLGLLYIKKKSIALDLVIFFATFISTFSHRSAIKIITWLLIRIEADKELIEISKRESPLKPSIPPGLDQVVTKRSL